MKYQKKTKPALWTTAFPAQVRSAQDEAKPAGRQNWPSQRRKLGLGHGRPQGARPKPKTLAQVFLAEEKKLYRQEARAFVQAAIDRGETCPVVAAIPELRDGHKYGHPISARLNEVHHTRGRGHGGRGPLLRDQRFWIAVSKQGHRWVHSNQDEARKHGWLCEKGQWNTPQSLA